MTNSFFLIKKPQFCLNYEHIHCGAYRERRLLHCSPYLRLEACTILLIKKRTTELGIFICLSRLVNFSWNAFKSVWTQKLGQRVTNICSHQQFITLNPFCCPKWVIEGLLAQAIYRAIFTQSL